MAEVVNGLDYSRKIALRIVEQLEKKWPSLHLDGFEQEDAINLIERCLPLTTLQAEAEAEVFDEAIEPSREVAHNAGPSLPQRLRTALGVPKDFGLLPTLELAIERLSNKELQCSHITDTLNE